VIDVAGEVVGYYDGSTSKDGKRITLAGHAAKPKVWREVEAIGARVLADDTDRPRAKSLHMWQANSLDDEFSVAKGWDKAKIDSLLNDLSNECLSPYGMREPVEDALVGAVCTVELDDYARAALDARWHCRPRLSVGLARHGGPRANGHSAEHPCMAWRRVGRWTHL
jgi:hypothetical protein